MELFITPETIKNYNDVLYVSLKMSEDKMETLIANHLNQVMIFGPDWSQKLHGITVGDLCDRQVRLSVSGTSTAQLIEAHLVSVIRQIEKIISHLEKHYEQLQHRTSLLTVHRKQQLSFKPRLIAAE